MSEVLTPGKGTSHGASAHETARFSEQSTGIAASLVSNAVSLESNKVYGPGSSTIHPVDYVSAASLGDGSGRIISTGGLGNERYVPPVRTMGIHE